MLLYSDDTICLILYLYLLVLAILAIFTCILNNLLDKIVDKSCNQLIIYFYYKTITSYLFGICLSTTKPPNKKWRKFNDK